MNKHIYGFSFKLKTCNALAKYLLDNLNTLWKKKVVINAYYLGNLTMEL